MMAKSYMNDVHLLPLIPAINSYITPLWIFFKNIKSAPSSLPSQLGEGAA